MAFNLCPSSVQVPEQTFENNAAVCTLIYAQQYAMIRNCTLTRP